MVKLTYKGKNFITFQEFTIRSGDNEIPINTYYKLMKHPLFAFRVNSKIFEVSSNSILEAPQELNEVNEIYEEVKEIKIDENKIEFEHKKKRTKSSKRK